MLGALTVFAVVAVAPVSVEDSLTERAGPEVREVAHLSRRQTTLEQAAAPLPRPAREPPRWAAWAAVSAAGPDASQGPVEAPGAAPATPAPVEATAPRRVAVTAAAAGASLLSLAAGIALGLVLPYSVFLATGRPSPFALTGGFLIGTGLGSLGAWYLAPQVVRLVGDTNVTPVRDGAFLVSRWAMAALGASVVTFGVGAGLEVGTFGRGQGVMIGAIVAGLISTLAVAVCETIGVALAWQPAAR